MIRPLVAILCIAFLVGCGGGGGSTADERPVNSLTTDKVSGLTATYKAVLDCTARVTVNGLQANVTGTYTLEALPTVVTSPVNGLEGRLVSNKIFLSAVGQSVDIEIREFIYVDSEGRWWSLGGEDTEGTRSWWDGNPTTYPAPVGQTVTGRILNLDTTLVVGQTIFTPAKDALSDDLSTVLFTRTSTRNTVAIEVVNTPLAR